MMERAGTRNEWTHRLGMGAASIISLALAVPALGDSHEPHREDRLVTLEQGIGIMGDEAVSVVVPWVICYTLALILIVTWWLAWRVSQAMLNLSQSLELAARELEAERDSLRSDLEAAQSRLEKISEYVSGLESKRITAQ